MGNKLTKTYNLRTADFDLYMRLRPRSILDMFQDAAGDHAIELGCGIQDIPQRGLAWVLTKTRYEVLAQPQMYSNVKVHTWPLKPGKFVYRREYLMEDLEGQVLVRGTSEWVIMDFADRKLKMVPDIYDAEDCLTTLAYPDEKIKKIPGTTSPLYVGVDEAKYMDQDTNFHVNNIVYADYIMNILKPDQNEPICRFEIDYHKEIRVGDVFNLNVQRDDANNRILVDGIKKDGNERLFNSAITYGKL